MRTLSERELSRYEVCQTLLGRAEDHRREAEEEFEKEHLMDLEVSSSQIWEDGNLMIEFKCPPAVVFKARKLLGEVNEKIVDLRYRRATEQATGLVV